MEISWDKVGHDLREIRSRTEQLVNGLSPEQLIRRSDPGKWSIAEIITHLADTEIVAGWRLRMILSTNGAPIQGFDQDSWAATFNYGRQDSRKSLETFRVLREYNLTMLKAVPKPLWENYGMHTERGKESAKHILRLFAGHDVNHLLQIEGIVKDGKKKK